MSTLPTRRHSNVPLPRPKQVFPMTTHVAKNLYESVKKEAKNQGVSVRAVVEWGLREFLITSNPRAAASIGIHAQASND